MWPVLLDMTKEESMQSLRNLELEAYAHLVSALRAQGPLNPDKRRLLKDTSQVLNIPQDRHKAEVRRAVNDEKLNTIAYHVTGLTESLEDWAQEGRRTVPLIPRLAPHTAYSAIADEVSESAGEINQLLPPPPATERKRLPALPVAPPATEMGKGAAFRVPEAPKGEECKKRKLPVSTEGSSLAQHLLGPSKMSRTQQIYSRQRKGGALKETSKLKLQPAKLPTASIQQLTNGPKLNVNIAAPTAGGGGGEETIEQIQNEINSYAAQKPAEPVAVPKLFAPVKPAAPGLTFKHLPGGPSLKLCAPKKPPAKPPTTIGQKLIVVSNAQTIGSSSILQKTLSIPLVKNISVKNFEKFKIVTTSSSPQLVTAANSINSLKHKVVTVKTNPTMKKVIPLSLFNSKGGIKVLPIGGKIVGKGTTTGTPPLYIVNTLGAKPLMTTQPLVEAAASPSKENGKSSVLGDILKASGVTTDDFDAQIEEFRIPNNHVIEGGARENVEGEGHLERDCHEDDEFVEQSGVKSDSADKHEQLYSDSDNANEESEEMGLQVQNSETASACDTGN